MVVTLQNVRLLLSNKETNPLIMSPLYSATGIKKTLWQKVSQVYKPDKKLWYLREDINVELSNGEQIHIPKGFETDLSSVPRFLWNFLSPYGDFLLAAVIHDYLYHVDYKSQSFADKEMLIWSQIINDDHIDNKRRYTVVCIFGRRVWIK